MQSIISSLQNPKIKQLKKLQEKSSERRKQGLAIVEGQREINLARTSGYIFTSIFYCSELADERFLSTFNPNLLLEVSIEVFEKLAYREGSDGLLALIQPAIHTLDKLELSRNPFIIVLESVEKPGNLGAILRTADAAAVDALIICDPKTDLYNPNVIRSSVGCLFTTQTAVATSQEVMEWLEQKSITAYAAALSAERFYHQTDLSIPCAVVMGTESTGLSEQWLSGAHTQIKIPMRGEIDSLNVSTSCAVLVFEAMRQRGFE